MLVLSNFPPFETEVLSAGSIKCSSATSMNVVISLHYANNVMLKAKVYVLYFDCSNPVELASLHLISAKIISPCCTGA
jgi:hypothetical protein